MARRYLWVVGALLGLFLVTAPAKADRLGGAYRGPYSDQVTPKDETSTDVTSSSSSAAPDSGAPSSSQGSNQGGSEGTTTTTTEGGGSTAPPEGGTPPPEGGTTGQEGGGSDPSAAPATEGEGSGSGSSAPPPSSSGAPSTASPGFGNSTTSRGPKTAVDDVQAYWSFWFEHNKELLLASRLKEESARAQMPAGSSVAIYSGAAAGGRSIRPLTEEMKTKVILPVLIDSATHPANFVRDAAVIALGKFGRPEVIPHLVIRLQDQDEDIVEDALLALGLTREKDALGPLLDSLRSPKDNVKAFAAMGLGLLGLPEARSALLREYSALLKVAPREKNKEYAASCVALALGMIGDGDTVNDLAVPLRSRGLDDLKVYVCQALGRIGGEKARDSLLRVATESRTQAVQAAAALALSNFPDKQVVNYLVKEGLKSGDTMTKVYSVLSLGWIGRTLPSNDGMRRQIRKELDDFCEKPQQNKYAAMYAALSLAIMGEDVAEEYITENLSEKGRNKLQKENLSALALSAAMLNLKSVAGDLREIVKKEAYDANLRGYAAFGLGLLGDERAKKEIADGMAGKKRDVLRSGCWALGLLGDRNDVDSLIDCVKLDNASLRDSRGAAAIAIGLIGDRKAVSPLVKLATEESDNETRAFAIVALGCLVDKDVVPRIPQLFANIHYRKQIPFVRDAFMDL